MSRSILIKYTYRFSQEQWQLPLESYGDQFIYMQILGRLYDSVFMHCQWKKKPYISTTSRMYFRKQSVLVWFQRAAPWFTDECLNGLNVHWHLHGQNHFWFTNITIRRLITVMMVQESFCCAVVCSLYPPCNAECMIMLRTRPKKFTITHFKTRLVLQEDQRKYSAEFDSVWTCVMFNINTFWINSEHHSVEQWGPFMALSTEAGLTLQDV